MNELHLFAGAGGGILAGQLLGHRCIGAVEIDPYCRSVIAHRQADGTFPPFPIFTDVRTFDARPYAGRADVVAGGFPCQDISVAGKGAGIDGVRSGLWREMARVVGDVRPRFVFVENSPALVTRGLGVVLGDLAALGYDCRWQVLSAADLDAPHLRERIWILGKLADADCAGQRAGRGPIPQPALGHDARRCSEDVPDTEGHRRRQGRPEQHPWLGQPEPTCIRGAVSDAGGVGLSDGRPAWHAARPVDRSGHGRDWPRWPLEPGMGRVVDGMASRAHRIRALGNGQVPRVAAAAFAMLASEFEG